MTIFFLFFAFAALISGYLLEGGHITGLIGPSAFIILNSKFNELERSQTEI